MPRTPPRVRASSAVEWLLAAAAIVGVLWAIAGSLRPSYRGGTQSDTGTIAVPVGVPAGASSTPLLIFEDGSELRTGMSEADALALLTAAAAPAGPDRASGSRRLREFAKGRMHGYLLVEAPTDNGAPRVAAIYLR